MSSIYTLINGYYDIQKQHWRGANLNTWADQTQWATWTTWVANPGGITLQIDDDRDTVDSRTPSLQLTCLGDRTISLKVSTTGLFTGEEIDIVFSEGLAVTVPSARYYRWTVTVASNSQNFIPYLFNVFSDYTTSGALSTEVFRNVDTSLLAGTVSGRILPTSSTSINSVDITTHDTSAYVDRAYSVPDTFNVTNISPIPGIVSKTPLTIVLRDYYGVPVDGICDVVVRGSPGAVLEPGGGIIII